MTLACAFLCILPKRYNSEERERESGNSGARSSVLTISQRHSHDFDD